MNLVIERLADFHVEPSSHVRRAATEWGATYLVGSAPGGVVLKTSPKPAADIAMQVHLLDAAAVDPTLPVPRVLRRDDGSTEVDLGDELGFVTTMCSGVPLEEIALDAQTIDQIATAQQRLIHALSVIDAAEAGVPETHTWSIDSLPAVSADSAGTIDRAWRPAVEDIARQLTEETLPLLRRMPKQALHADFNLSNLLFERGRLTGIIDFGDAVCAPRVLDVAVATCYLAIAAGGLEHPLVQRFLDTTEALGGLDGEERALLPALVAARCALVLLLGRAHAAEHPERAAYALRYDEGAVTLLRSMTRAGSTCAP